MSPINFKVAYAFAAIPTRIALENHDWNRAATLQLHPNFSWGRFPWQEAIIHFGRLLGFAHLGNLSSARSELNIVTRLHDTLLKQQDQYKANQVGIQLKAGEAWVEFYSGKKSEALVDMKTAADMEDATEKHPVTPCEVLPARELYAEMLSVAGEFQAALLQYQLALKKNPNRFNSLYGAAHSAKVTGDRRTAFTYYKQLLEVADPVSCSRLEVKTAKSFVGIASSSHRR